jgi:zinc D-Ala-D-Ala dipeptidase
MRWDRTKGRPEPIRALNRVTERENGETLVDLRDVAPELRIMRPQTIPFVRETVARMALQAAALLPAGVHLGITDAWRPLERQQRIYDWMMGCAKEAFPNRDYRALRRTVNRWVAPTDQKAPPGHCTGAAIDVNLVDAAGEPLDVSSPYSRLSSGPTYTLGLTPEAQANRTLLVETMLEVGFSNCRDEWWHYSYGDAGWAVRTGRSECFYGVAHLERELYLEQERISAEAMAERPNPFLEPPVLEADPLKKP